MQIKRIETQEEKEKRDKRNKTIIGIILVLLMVLSTAGYAVMDRGKTSKVKYNGLTFEKTDQGWYTKTSQFELTTSFNPNEVKNISYNLGFLTLNDFSGSVFIDANRYEEKQIANELFKNLAVSRVQFACLKEEENMTECAELPIKDCNNLMFIIKKTNETKMFNDNKCIVINAKDEDLLRTADRFLFGIYGIIN